MGKNCVGLPAGIHYRVGAVSLLLSCAISIVGEITVSFFPFTSAAQEQKKIIFLRTLSQGSKAFFYRLWPSSFIPTRGKKTLKGTLSKLLGLKIGLPWQCSHLDGLILRSTDSFPMQTPIHPPKALVRCSPKDHPAHTLSSETNTATHIQASFWLNPSQPLLNYVYHVTAKGL